MIIFNKQYNKNMLYFLGVNMSEKKPLKIALSSIFGIGKKSAKIICIKLNFNSKLRISKLTDYQINDLSNEIKKSIFGQVLKNKIRLNIKKLMEINCYKGFRHKFGLPVRGQRTHSNGMTRKYLSKKIKKKKKPSKNKKVY